LIKLLHTIYVKKNKEKLPVVVKFTQNLFLKRLLATKTFGRCWIISEHLGQYFSMRRWVVANTIRPTGMVYHNNSLKVSEL